jgi:hypothetical protein
MIIAAVRAIQRRLKELGHYAGRIDGDRGPQTDRAVDLALAARSGELPDAWPGWSGERKAVASLQMMCIDAGLEAGEIDGFWGPQTEFAFASFEVLRKTGEPPLPWRDDEPLDVNPNNWPREDQGRSRLFTGPMGRPGARRRRLPCVASPAPGRCASPGTPARS